MDVARAHRHSGIVRRSPRQSPDLDSGDSFRWLFTTEYQEIVRTVFLIVRDRELAEDLTQEAFIQLLGHWAKVTEYDRPGAWVRRVAIRLAVRECRRNHRRTVLEVLAPWREGHTSTSVRDVDLLQAIGSLSPQQRAVVVLFYFEDRPMDEIAAVLGCSVSTGWVHLHRARRRLASVLGEEADDVT